MTFKVKTSKNEFLDDPRLESEKEIYKGFSRDKNEEGGEVYRWYESEDGSIISVVEGYFPNEANVRVTHKDRDSFEIRGDKKIILGKSDEEIIKSALRRVE
jgi:hypothetical protein